MRAYVSATRSIVLFLVGLPSLPGGVGNGVARASGLPPGALLV